MNYGPTQEVSKWIDSDKYCGDGEIFSESIHRVTGAACDSEALRIACNGILLNGRFLPAGRNRAAVGSPRHITAMNCYASQQIEDSIDGIMDSLHKAAKTLKAGGGIGYDFSTLRPDKALIVSTDSFSTGPLGFMPIFDTMCKSMRGGGGRRGAQMGVLRVDHPDIEKFIHAKTKDQETLSAFNISVAVTDEFMRAVEDGSKFDLRFEGELFKVVDARALWDQIMRNTWDWAEPGVIFIDRMNEENNLKYCETIYTTNPCSEQPLPPNGACLLGSFNLVNYLYDTGEDFRFKSTQFTEDIPHIVRMMDNIIDIAKYPLQAQKDSETQKRRMGLGITGFASALAIMGIEYGSGESILFLKRVLKILRDESYYASTQLAKEKGHFTLYNPKYLDSPFIQSLPETIQQGIRDHGIRNSHLISLAPCGTISLAADNISSGIEPPFVMSDTRSIISEDGPISCQIEDYGYRVHGITSKTGDQISVDSHLAVLLAAQPFVDSAISKTINVGDDTTWDEFKDIYYRAWKGGAKGLTTFRKAGKRFGIFGSTVKEDSPQAEMCFTNADGSKSCE